jgi:hypothetical protein
MKRYSKQPRDYDKEEVAESQSTTPFTTRGLSHTDVMGESMAHSLAQSHSSQWNMVSTSALSRLYERQQVALFCCRKTINLQTQSLPMPDHAWADIVPRMMESSQALSSILTANAVNYLAKSAGAKTTPGEALNYYSLSLKVLQQDLYDPVRQKSDETLFTVIMMAIFEVTFFILISLTARFAIITMFLHG